MQDENVSWLIDRQWSGGREGPWVCMLTSSSCRCEMAWQVGGAIELKVRRPGLR